MGLSTPLIPALGRQAGVCELQSEFRDSQTWPSLCSHSDSCALCLLLLQLGLLELSTLNIEQGDVLPECFHSMDLYAFMFLNLVIIAYCPQTWKERHRKGI